MLGRLGACWASLALTGCAVISGPCAVDGALRRLTCTQGGWFVLIAPQASIVAIGALVPEGHVWVPLRPHEGP